MANEAVIVEKFGNNGDVMDYTVDANTTIEKNTLMKLVGTRSGQAVSAKGDVFIGIASVEKDSTNTNQVNLGVLTNVTADLVLSGGCTVGDFLAVSGANTVYSIGKDSSSGHLIVGMALETQTDGNRVETRIRK